MNFSQSCDSRPFIVFTTIFTSGHLRSKLILAMICGDEIHLYRVRNPRDRKKLVATFIPRKLKKIFFKTGRGAKEQMSKHNSCNEIIDRLISLTQFIFDSFENKTIDKKRPSFDRRLKGFHFWWNSLVHITYDLFWFSIFFDIALSRTETTKRKQIADGANWTVEFQTLNWIDFVSTCHLRFSIRQVQIRIWNCNHQ